MFNSGNNNENNLVEKFFFFEYILKYRINKTRVHKKYIRKNNSIWEYGRNTASKYIYVYEQVLISIYFGTFCLSCVGLFCSEYVSKTCVSQ